MSTVTIKVGFNTSTNDITIQKNNGVPNQYKISDIKSIYNEFGTIGDNYNAMIQEQQTLNYLDSIKDGANVATLNSLNMYPSAERVSNPKNYLHQYESNVINSAIPYISKIAWTKINKRQALNPPLPINDIFRDSGIGADVFIATGFQLYSTIATYIDPATRAKPDIVWPSKNDTIEFSKEFMDLFGFEDSSLTSKTVANDKFNYSLTTYGVNYTNDGKKPDQNLNYFSGNTNKNKMLKSSDTPQQQKKALISLKEWGDKMQVLILYVWSRIYKNNTYAMITCDKVVYTLCVLLKVKCIFTGEIVENKIKKYTIEVYEPSDNPKKDAINRYNKKKANIEKEENAAFIQMIKLLMNNPSQTIYVDGVEEPFTFAAEFYEKIYKDISDIQQKLIDEPKLDSNVGESEIEIQTKQLAEKYLLIHFIKKIKNKIKITRITKYTNTNKIKPSFNNSTKSFFELATTLQTNTNKRGGAISKTSSSLKTIPLSASKSSKYSKSPEIQSIILKKSPRITNIPVVINSVEFIESDFYMKPIWYDYYVNVPVEEETNKEDQFIDSVREEKRVDLNGLLLSQVLKIAESKNISRFIDSIYSMVLYNAYFNNGIPLDYVENSATKSDLEKIIEQIITEDLDLSNIETQDSSAKMDIDNISSNSLDVPSMMSTNIPEMATANSGGKKRKATKRSSKKYKKMQKKSKTRKIRKVKK